MKYLSEINAFERRMRRAPLSVNAQLLWYKLIQLANRLHWPGDFTLDNIRGDVSSDQFITIFSVVVAFYFGTQTQRAASSSGETALPDTDQKKE